VERDEAGAPSELELDALAETSNIGMGHAAMALSRLVHREVHLEVPNLRILDPRRIDPPFGDEESVGLSLEICGGVCGSLLILLPASHGRLMVHDAAQEEPPRPFAPAEIADLTAGGEAVAAAYLQAVGALLKLPLSCVFPVFECGPARTIADAALSRVLALDPPLIMQTVFSVEGMPGSGTILLIPGADGVQAILSALGTR